MNVSRAAVAAVASAISVMLLLAFASTATAGHDWPDRSGARAMLSERMAAKLDLDDDQRQAITNIFEAARPEFADLREQSRANREALRSLDAGADDYSIELQSLATERGRLATEATLLKHRVRADVYTVLNEEQREKLENRKDRWREGRRSRRGG